MTQEETGPPPAMLTAFEAFADRLDDLIERFERFGNLSRAELIGALEFAKAKQVLKAMDDYAAIMEGTSQ